MLRHRRPPIYGYVTLVARRATDLAWMGDIYQILASLTLIWSPYQPLLRIYSALDPFFIRFLSDIGHTEVLDRSSLENKWKIMEKWLIVYLRKEYSLT
jgi:hypothetical protein